MGLCQAYDPFDNTNLTHKLHKLYLSHQLARQTYEITKYIYFDRKWTQVLEQVNLI